MTIDEALDRLTIIDTLPEVGPDLVQEASECLDIVLDHQQDPDARNFARRVYIDTVNRSVNWNP